MKNADAPFAVKQTVWNSALMSAILYSSETWLTDDLRSVEQVYNRTLKELLAVRQSTSNTLVYVEASTSDAKSAIKDKQARFLEKLFARDDYQHSYTKQAVDLAMQHRTPMGRMLQMYCDQQGTSHHAHEQLERSKQKILDSDSSRFTIYRDICGDFTKCAIYERDSRVSEPARIAVTRLRLSSH